MSYIIKYLNGGWKKCKAEERDAINRILIFGVMANLMALSMAAANAINELGLTVMSGIGCIVLLIIAFESYYSYRMDNIEKMLDKLTRSKKNG